MHVGVKTIIHIFTYCNFPLLFRVGMYHSSYPMAFYIINFFRLLLNLRAIHEGDDLLTTMP